MTFGTGHSFIAGCETADSSGYMEVNERYQLIYVVLSMGHAIEVPQMVAY